jgi:hypothetical protein
MKTENILKGIRLMTFIIAIGSFSMSANGLTKGGNPGGGESGNAGQSAKESERIENWMLEEENFTVKGNETYSYDWVYISEREPEVGLEEWMMDYENFMTKEEQKDYQIEDWMLEERNFKVNKENESESLKKWMIDSDFWKIKS